MERSPTGYRFLAVRVHPYDDFYDTLHGAEPSLYAARRAKLIIG